MAAAPLAHVTLVRAVVRLGDQGATTGAGSPAAGVAPAPAPAPGGPPAIEQLEEEARDVVEVEGRLGRGQDDVWKPFTLDLRIRPRFHVNAHEVGEGGLVATSVAGVMGGVRQVRYPPAQALGGGASGWAGRVRIEGEIEHRGGGAAAVEIEYQACDDARCLPPVSRLVRLG
jgi:hypothetical protein